jgi:D-alanyl-D-alanine carboxypeptidase
MARLPRAFVGVDGIPDPSSSHAVVPWWSFTKTLIAACALLLSERRRIALDAPLPGLPYTPRQLLQHRAGVRNYGGLAEYHAAVERGERPWPADELLRRLPPDDLLFAPGTGWAYSNIGYLLLRHEVERAADSDLAEALSTCILRPLGLTAARCAATAEDMQRTALPPPHVYDPGWVYHGCVIGPVAEAALALHRLLAGPLLTAASREAMLDCFAIGGRLSGRPWMTTGYGLGVMMGAMQDPRTAIRLDVIGHSAGGPGCTGAVYSTAGPRGRRTAAAFAGGNDDGIAEFEVLRILLAGAMPDEMRS